MWHLAMCRSERAALDKNDVWAPSWAPSLTNSNILKQAAGPKSSTRLASSRCVTEH
jgi:hypothetical protein